MYYNMPGRNTFFMTQEAFDALKSKYARLVRLRANLFPEQ